MKAKEFYDYITSKMTPEQALMKLLEGTVIKYEKLKFDEGKEVHPIIIISMAAMDMGWDFLIEQENEDNKGDIRGLATGTKEYLNAVFKKVNIST